MSALASTPGRPPSPVPGIGNIARPQPRLSDSHVPDEPAVEVDSVLAAASAIRFPDLSQKSGREKVDALADHIMQTAITRGELEELRLEAHVALYTARKRLGRLPAASSKGKVAEEARRAADPELADEIDHYRWVIDRCTEQINRLGGTDYDAASRCYTLLGG